MGNAARVIAITAIWVGASTARAAVAEPVGIFDDAWIPRATPVPSPPTTRRAPSSAEAGPHVVPNLGATTRGVARRPIPPRRELDAARDIFWEVFSGRMKDTSLAGRQKLSEALLAQADDSANVPAHQFILLVAAMNTGVEAGNLPLAFRAVDRMAAAFDVDAVGIKAEMPIKLVREPAPAALLAGNASAAMALANDLVRRDDFATAKKVCAAAIAAAVGDPAVRFRVVRHAAHLDAVRDAGEQVARAVEKLAATPHDPAASLEVGKYLCFYKNDWANGLRLIARGSDPDLKKLAAADLAGATTAAEQAALADGWWAVAEAASYRYRVGMSPLLSHAAAWYRKALPEMKGLERARAEKRIEAAGSSVAPFGEVPAPDAVQAGGPSKTADAPGVVDLTGVKPVSVSVGYYELGVNVAPGDARAPKEHGQPAGRFLFAHAPSQLRFDAVPWGGKVFAAKGTLGGAGSNGVTFVVACDGKRLFRSRLLRPNDVIDVEVKVPPGCKTLDLIVEANGNKFADWSSWISPVIREPDAAR